MTRALSGVLFHNAARLLLFFSLSQRMRERFKNVLMSKRGGDGEPRSSAHREKRQSCGFYMYVFFLSLWSAIILLNNPLGVGTWGVAEEEEEEARALYPVLVFIVLLLIAIFVFFWYCSSSRRCLYICATQRVKNAPGLGRPPFAKWDGKKALREQGRHLGLRVRERTSAEFYDCIFLTHWEDQWEKFQNLQFPNNFKKFQ
jgi:hypothetical protein